jgi:hypothetical protein
MMDYAAKKRTNVILLPRTILFRGEDQMILIRCKVCKGKAIVHARKELDVTMSQLYCSCKDPECGHTFVMDLCFSHTLSPSAQQAKDVVVSFLRALPDAERQLMLANL